MTKALKRHQDNYLNDLFLAELERAKGHIRKAYPGKVRVGKDLIGFVENPQTEQTIIWLDHLRKLYIEQHHPHVLEDSLYNQKGV